MKSTRRLIYISTSILLLGLLLFAANPLFIRFINGAPGNESILVTNNLDEDICEIYVQQFSLIEVWGYNKLESSVSLKPGESTTINGINLGPNYGRVKGCDSSNLIISSEFIEVELDSTKWSISAPISRDP